MKNSFLITVLASLVAATPIAVPVVAPEPIPVVVSIDARQLDGITKHEYTEGGCRPVIFFFARGSTEIGNMGLLVGPPTADGLKATYGDAGVAIEGVDYDASLDTNFLPGGADPKGVAEMKGLFESAAAKCPNSILLGGGYSQGAAVAHGAIKALSPDVQNKIAGVVTFGDTQNLQDNGQIPNFPKEKVLVICNDGDAVCQGQLIILLPHLEYTERVPEAVSFLTGKADAAGA